MKTLSPWLQLGLPDPSGKVLQDSKLVSTYQDFCNSLSLDAAGRFIKCDGKFFYRRDGWIEKNDFSRLHLLCALYHPNKTQTENIRGRFMYFIDGQNRRGGGHVYSPEILAFYRQFLEFRSSSDYKSLTENTVAGKTIGRVKAENPTPGLTWLSELQVSRYSKNWASVLYWGDEGYDSLDAFPTILGFVKMEGLERNVVALLIEEELFTMYGFFTETGGVTDLVSLAWMRDEGGGCDDDNFSYASFFLQFSDKELDHIRAEYGSLTDRGLLEIVQGLYSHSEKIDPTKIAVEYGPPTGPGYFEKVEAWLEEKLEQIEEEESKRLDELEKNAGPFEGKISGLLDALLGKRPSKGLITVFYDKKRWVLRRRILEFIWDAGRMPTAAEITLP